MFLIGVTGGIASGKSRICSWFKHQKIPVISADDIAHDISRPGGSAYQEICNHFEPILSRDLYIHENDQFTPFINRSNLGNYVFIHQDAKKKLESILHPLIRKKMILYAIYYILLGYTRIVFEIPLLYETGLNKWMDRVIVVNCSEQIQLDRLLKRSTALTKQQAIDRIRSQENLAQKALRADIVIDNSLNWHNTEKQLVYILFHQLKPSIYILFKRFLIILLPFILVFYLFK